MFKVFITGIVQEPFVFPQIILPDLAVLRVAAYEEGNYYCEGFALAMQIRIPVLIKSGSETLEISYLIQRHKDFLNVIWDLIPVFNLPVTKKIRF
jgi:hypothetical protein